MTTTKPLDGKDLTEEHRHYILNMIEGYAKKRHDHMRNTMLYKLGVAEGEAAGDTKSWARYLAEDRVAGRASTWLLGWKEGFAQGLREGWHSGWAQGEVNERASTPTLLLAQVGEPPTTEEIEWLQQRSLAELPTVEFARTMRSAEQFWYELEPYADRS